MAHNRESGNAPIFFPAPLRLSNAYCRRPESTYRCGAPLVSPVRNRAERRGFLLERCIAKYPFRSSWREERRAWFRLRQSNRYTKTTVRGAGVEDPIARTHLATRKHALLPVTAPHPD